MSQVNFALVGCGRVSSRHVDALMNKAPGAKIVAVCDIVPERAERYSRRLHVPAFTSAAEMYKAIDIDVVDIATPSGDHYARVMEALSFDQHVVVEKPIALRLEHADEMIREARKRNCQLWVAHQNRYNPAVMKTKETVDSNRLGKIIVGTVRVRWMRDQSYYDQDNWHGTWAMDGGVVAQQAIHHVDALRWLVGEIESVEALCATRLVEIECEDLCVATLRFENGALGIVEAMTAARPRDIEASLSIMGENGTIVLGGLALNEIDFWEFADPEPEDQQVAELFSQEIPNAYGFGHDVLFSRVVRSVLQEAPIEISAEEGRKALEVLHAIYASCELGRRIWLKNRPVSSRLGLRAVLSRKKAGKIARQESLTSIQACTSNTLDANTIGDRFIAGIIGDRPSQSAKSPWIWNQTFEHLGLDALYLPFDVEAKNLPRLIDELRACENYLGGSVTMPYKVAVMEYLDEVDPQARLIGAVNTIVRTLEGRLVGYNTDAKGGIDALQTCTQPGQSSPFLGSLEGLNVLMIGAGGAGRAMACYLAEAIGSGNLIIVNRTYEHSAALAADVAEVYHNTTVAPVSELVQVAQGVNLVVNCTTCGQSGLRVLDDGQVVTLEPYSSLSPASPVAVQRREGAAMLETYSICVKCSKDDIATNNRLSMELVLQLRPEVCFFDIVYSPLETVMLRHARFAGHRTLNGKSMNIGQAAEAMFNIVCKSYFQERGLWTRDTYSRIVETMYKVW